jgi:hypothetical protein
MTLGLIPPLFFQVSVQRWGEWAVMKMWVSVIDFVSVPTIFRLDVEIIR